jgi:tripartite-type tricarboxylate transporter receptor subunit TctC
LPLVPVITDFIKDPVRRAQIEFSLSWLAAGRPFVAPPGVPADRVKLLRDSFMKVVSSSEFIEEAQKMSLDVSPMSGEQVQELVNRIYATPPDVIRPVKEIMAAK